MSSPPSTLIMGLGHPRQTAFLGSLGRAGLPVHAVHTETKAHRLSRYLTSFALLPADPGGQLDQVEQFGRATGGLLIPTNDNYVALVAQNRERLARHFTIPLPDWEIVGRVFDRETAYATAQAIGIGVPRHWCPKSEAELHSAVAALDPDNSDYMLKTRSVLGAFADPQTGRQTKAAPRGREAILRAAVEWHARIGDYPIVQEVVPGSADSSIGITMVIGPHGGVVLAYGVRRLRLAAYRVDGGYVHPYELGSVVWCETVHDAEAMEAARAIARAFTYTGPLTVEFRRVERTGALYLTKLEPRPVRATALSRAIGMDIPNALVAAFTGGTPRVAADYPDGVGWLWFQAYGASLIRNPHRTRRDMLRVAREFHRIKAFAEDLADPVPIAAGLLRMGSRAALRPFSRLRPAPVSALQSTAAAE